MEKDSFIDGLQLKEKKQNTDEWIKAFSDDKSTSEDEETQDWQEAFNK